MAVGEIFVSNIDELIKIVAGLVREGLTHTVSKNGDKWQITLNGGF